MFHSGWILWNHAFDRACAMGRKPSRGRLQSLAAAQDILTASEWRGAELRVLTRHLLASYSSGADCRIQISGPGVNLPPELATPMGLVLNELATNAVKHGALSFPLGHIEVQWSVRESGPRPRHLLDWRESGGPTVSEPQKLGFGTTLIDRSLATAKVTGRYLRDGFHCTIEFDVHPASAGLG
jgi:two-component sensor histidine kinase